MVNFNFVVNLRGFKKFSRRTVRTDYVAARRNFVIALVVKNIRNDAANYQNFNAEIVCAGSFSEIFVVQHKGIFAAFAVDAVNRDFIAVKINFAAVLYAPKNCGAVLKNSYRRAVKIVRAYNFAVNFRNANQAAVRHKITCVDNCNIVKIFRHLRNCGAPVNLIFRKNRAQLVFFVRGDNCKRHNAIFVIYQKF